MSVRIRSLLTSGPLMVPLVTGQTLRLSPGEVSDELPDFEADGNAKVEKLTARGLIGVETIEKSEKTETKKGRQRSGARSDAGGTDEESTPADESGEK